MEIVKNIGFVIICILAIWKLYDLFFPRKEIQNNEREVNMSKMFIICLATYMYEQETGKQLNGIVPPQEFVNKASAKILEWGKTIKQ